MPLSSEQLAALPLFAELPLLESLGIPHSWGLLDGELGTLELLTEEAVAHAATLVRIGRSIGLNLPLDFLDPPLFGRAPLAHEIFYADRNTVDDRLDAFYPQASSQWDGFRHVGAREYGFYGGVQEEFTPGTGPLGIQSWAECGIAGRGVLLDIPALRTRQGRPYAPTEGEPIEVDDLEQAASDQGVEFRSGDILCVRTGWVQHYREADATSRWELALNPHTNGLAGDAGMAEWLWNRRFAAIATDNPSIEVNPTDPARGFLHRRLLPSLGFALAELLDLEALNSACTEDSRWDFLFAAAPLNLRGGVGSTANALALR
ncbi:cyclase family protein [Salinibacterium sp. ZJ454]|uniref:cyclase family protein n=1 Tax=Salinibacterium sp. ZJ454 TaxID=2708339 RepID=UPI00141FD3A3|nr:cyclase family protein [Salinibacterium sp. ZJ454]